MLTTSQFDFKKKYLKLVTFVSNFLGFEPSVLQSYWFVIILFYKLIDFFVNKCNKKKGKILIIFML